MAAKIPQITVLGSLNIDLVSYVSHHPLPGETMTSSSFAVSPGGKGANQAVACAKLSRSRTVAAAGGTGDGDETAHVRMLGAVGADTYGETLSTNLSAHGVDVSGLVVRKEGKTGLAIIVVDEPTGQNRIILSPESNHSLAPTDFTTLPDPLPDLLIMQLEIPIPTVLQALAAARAAGVAVLLNPAPAVPLPEDSYTGLAHLIVNETEASILSGLPESTLDTLEGLETVAKVFLDRGVTNVIITLGGRGVYYSSSGNVTTNGLIPAEKAKVVDTTAAGDTFVGQYALEFVQREDKIFNVEAAVRKANRAAARTVEKLGAQVSIPWRDEL